MDITCAPARYVFIIYIYYVRFTFPLGDGARGMQRHSGYMAAHSFCVPRSDDLRAAATTTWLGCCRLGLDYPSTYAGHTQ